ncbi:MAG: M56 family metallopeptidase, partial [Planctomycetia bacterium]
MNSFIDSVTGMVTQVAKTSWQAAILAGLVLLFTILLRKHLSARWQAALWLVVVVRLLMPFAPESSVSLFNYFYSPIEVSWSSTPSPEIISPLSSKNEFSHVDSEEPPAHDFSKEPPQDKVVTDLAPSALPKASESIVDRPHLQLEAKSKTAFGWPPSQTGRLIIVSVWILGILVLIGHMLLVMFRLRLLLRSCDPIEDRLV